MVGNGSFCFYCRAVVTLHVPLVFWCVKNVILVGWNIAIANMEREAKRKGKRRLLWELLDGFSEKAMGPHSSTLAWKILWMQEPGRLQSMGLLRVGHDWAASLSLFIFMHWRRKWQPTPVFLPRESQGRGSLVGCCLWGRTESDTTEAT